jgi:hypothetical protein
VSDVFADQVVELVRGYVGCSLSHDRERLGRLVARGVDDPERVVTLRTNCGTFSLGILWALDVQHWTLRKPYPVGAAVTWLYTLGRECRMLHAYEGQELRPGMLLHYRSRDPNKNDDHFEWLLSELDEHGMASHAGGGRPDNAITEGRSDVRTSSERPLRWLYDVPELLSRCES